MAFTYEVTQTIPLRDAHGMVGPLTIVVGTFTNGGSDTGGEIDTGTDLVLFATAVSASGENAPQVQINTASDGLITITTQADHDGVWMAVCQGYA